MGNENAILEQMKELFEDLCVNADKFLTKGNSAAGQRSRVASIKLTKVMKEWRKASLERDRRS